MFTFLAVRLVTLYIPTTALELDTVIYKHVVYLLHISAFFGHRISPWTNTHCVHSSMVIQAAKETKGLIPENDDFFAVDVCLQFK